MNHPKKAAKLDPAARDSDFGAIGSAPVKKGELTHVDTWAGRGGFGSKLFQEHGHVGIIYGGTHIDGVSPPEFDRWIAFFTRDKHAAACEFWYEMHKGIHEMLREYPV